MARVTAIVLAYNRPRYLQEALDSIARQTVRPAEVIIIDDASPCGALVEQVDARGLPASFVRVVQNSGPATAAAIGLRLAGGDYVSFLNDDDVWYPDFVERLSTALDAESSAGMAFCDHDVMDADGREDEAFAAHLAVQYGRDGLSGGLFDSPLSFARAALLQQSVPAQSFGMTRREALDPRIVLAGGDVWDYFVPLSVAMGGRSGVYLPPRLGSYRRSPDGITASWGAADRRIAGTCRRLAADMLVLRTRNLSEMHAEVRVAAARRVASSLLTALRSGRPRMLRYWIDQTAQAILRPDHPPARGRGLGSGPGNSG